MTPTSHPIVEAGDKVVIKGVELFMAFDPDIDDARPTPRSSASTTSASARLSAPRAST